MRPIWGNPEAGDPGGNRGGPVPASLLAPVASLAFVRNNAAAQKLRLPRKGGSRATAWIVLVVALLATAAAWRFLGREAEESVRRRFDIRVEVIRQWLAERANGYEIAVLTGAGLVAASEDVTPQEWDQFVRSLQIETSYPGLTQLAFVAPADVAISPPGSGSAAQEPASGESSLAVQFVAPGQLPEFSRDFAAVPEYRHAAREARDTGQTTVSEYQPASSAGAANLPALFRPLYSRTEGLESVAWRRQRLTGWLVAWFDPEVLLVTLPPALARHLDVEVFAAENLDAAYRVYDSDPSREAAANDASSTLWVRLPFQMPGRSWTLVAEAGPQFAGSEPSGATLVFLCGLITSLILFVVTETLASSRMRALAVAKLMTDRLRHNEAYSRAIVENAPVGILTFAEDGALETVNSAAERIFGYRSHELGGRTFEELLEEPSGLRAKGYEGFSEFRGETGRRADGASFPMELSIWRTQVGERRGYTAIVVDVTERRQAAAALRAERDFSAAVLNLAPALVVVMDLEGRIVAFNRACEETTAYTFDEMKGKVLADLLLPVEERAAARRIVGQLCGGVHPIHYENFWITKQGHRRLISWANAALLDSEGAPKFVIACGEDVTERREAEKASERYIIEMERAQQTTERQAEMLAKQAEELSVARDAALGSAALKTQFLTNMSHEIRTPMSGVLGMTHLILGTRLTEEQRDYALTIRSSAEALLVIINDILDFSKIEAGKLQFEALDFNLAETVHGAVQLLAQQATGKGIEIKSSIEPDVPTWVRGDRGRLRQVLLNLIGNAVKFTNQGGVEVSLALKDKTRDQVELSFAIRDTGIGIAPSTLKKLFHPFVQADGSTSRRHGGTGLGLAICKQLVEHMGGAIGCESVPGEGSLFHFTIKLGMRKAVDLSRPLEAQPSNDTAAARGDTARPGGDGASQGTRLRVLVAEDNPVNQKVVIRMLQRLGCEAEVAANGQEALAALDRASYDLILMDCQMPEMDGYQATAEIRRRESGRSRVPIIALTAHAIQGAREKCLSAGMDDYISKPIDPHVLIATLRRWSSSRIELGSERVEANDVTG